MDLQTLERYRIESPQAIREYLCGAAASRASCSLRASGRPDSFVSRLSGLDDDANALILDAPRAPVIERVLPPGASASIEFALDHVRILFESRVQRFAAHGGAIAVFVAMPDALFRLQRRETFRVSVPDEAGLRLTLEPGQPGLTELALQNLSTGGVAVLATGNLARFETGRVFHNAMLELRDGQRFELALRVRHAAVMRRVGTDCQLRVGLQFLQVPPGFEMAISRAMTEFSRASAGEPGGL
ncbi:MAG TPA: flagellar regulator YcgR PilZN domain-containing protein [Burkholderiaceae bacterium]|nr:flagellar regulator YcgR PilZN domain-containing protein [Burkholderiaceae bacterium]